jgi:hypothetical protein
MKREPIEIHPIEAECYVCHKIRPMASLRHIGNGKYECAKPCGKAYHKPSTKAKVWEQHEQERKTTTRRFIVMGSCSFEFEVTEEIS